MQKPIGFTLIELLFTIAVLIILISIASPAYNHLFSKQALVASSERLYHFLVLAKSQSIKYNKKVYVHFCQKGTSHEWRMALSEDNHCDCFVQSSCTLNGSQQNVSLSDGQMVLISPSDITFTGLQASYSPMRFSVNAGSITLNDNNGYKLKVIQSVMRLRMCSPDSQQLGYKQC